MVDTELRTHRRAAAGTPALRCLGQLAQGAPGALLAAARTTRGSSRALAIVAEGIGWLLVAAVLLIPLASWLLR